MRAPRHRHLVALVLAAGLACDSSGSDRTLGLTAFGSIAGAVHFDANGSGTLDAGDPPLAGARVAVLTPVSRDTVLVATTGADGTFALDGVPVGTYAVALDSASVGDSASVVAMDTPAVTVRPGETVQVSGTAGVPHHAAVEVRTLPLGVRVFVTGVALHARETFSDTLLHVVDTSGAIRAVRVRPGSAGVAAGDSVRLRGQVAVRLGQRALDDVTVYAVAPTLIPSISTITTAVAATAGGGVLDAALVRVAGAVVADTATVAGSLTMTVNDGSGPLSVLLDRAADAAFRAPLPPNLYDAGTTFDLLGVLVPTGTGTFVLRPRSSFDLTVP